MNRLSVLFLFVVSLFGCMQGDKKPADNKQVVYSTEVGRDCSENVSDDVLISGYSPASGLLFGVWTKIPANWSNWEHNMDVFVVEGDTWKLRGLVANINRTTGVYNANTMVFAKIGTNHLWAGDYNNYYGTKDYTPPVYPEDMTGWVWVGWQIVVNADSLSIRQWLKFGPDGQLFLTHDDTALFSTMRNFMLDPNNNPYEYSFTPAPDQNAIQSWTPGEMRSFQVGKYNAQLWNAVVYERSSMPSIEELEAIARGTAPDSGAWGKWSLTWTEDGPDVADSSGNKRNLQPMAEGARFHRGEAVPALP